MKEKGYRKLEAWKSANELALEVYDATEVFPQKEMYGLTTQLRRAALSVPTNLVEGHGRQGKVERRHFVNIALGSLAETEYLLEFSAQLKYLDSSRYEQLEHIRERAGALIWGLHRSLS